MENGYMVYKDIFKYTCIYIAKELKAIVLSIWKMPKSGLTIHKPGEVLYYYITMLANVFLLANVVEWLTIE